MSTNTCHFQHQQNNNYAKTHKETICQVTALTIVHIQSRELYAIRPYVENTVHQRRYTAFSLQITTRQTSTRIAKDDLSRITPANPKIRINSIQIFEWIIQL